MSDEVSDALLDADLKIDSLSRQLQEVVSDNLYLRGELENAHYDVHQLQLQLQAFRETLNALEADLG